jgi:hypothetical protein
MKSHESRAWRYLLLVLVAVGLTTLAAGCNTTPPPPQSTDTRGMEIILTTDPNPPRPGPVTLIVELKDAEGRPVNGADVSVSTGMPSMGHGGPGGQFVEQGGGKYSAQGTFGMGGVWRATITIVQPGQEPIKKEIDFTIQ